MYMYAHYARVPTQKPYWVGHTVYTVHAITVISILFFAMQLSCTAIVQVRTGTVFGLWGSK